MKRSRRFLFIQLAKSLIKGFLRGSKAKGKKRGYAVGFLLLVVVIFGCETTPSPSNPNSSLEKVEASPPQGAHLSPEESTEVTPPPPKSMQETPKTTTPDLSETPLLLGEPAISIGEVPAPPAFPEPSSSIEKQKEVQPVVATDKGASSLSNESQKGSTPPQAGSGTSPRQERSTETKPSSSSAPTEQKKTPTPPVLKPTEPVVAEQKVEPPTTPFQRLPEPAVSGTGGLPEAFPYSRSVRALVGQLVEIPFQGGGWIYLGEMAGRRGLIYDSRRTDPEGQSFIFRAENVGLYSLKFFRQDFLQDYVINDYVRVEVVQGPEITETGGFRLAADRGRVVAEPRWPPRSADVPAAVATQEVSTAGVNQSERALSTSAARPEQGNDTTPSSAVPPANTGSTTAVSSRSAVGSAPASPGGATGTASPLKTGTATAGGGTQSVSATGASAESPLSSLSAVSTSTASRASSGSSESTNLEVLLRQARDAYEKNQYGVALDLLNQIFALYPAGTDETLWLMGQIFETQGPQRDIKKAYDAYKRLLGEFPTSSRYDEAQRRIRYIERFYFNIR